MIIERITTPGLSIHTYLVGCPKTDEAIVIDPTRHVDKLISVAGSHGLRITHSVDTHVHADFLSGGPELKERLGSDLTIHSSALGGEEWLQDFTDRPLHSGDEIQVGNILLRSLHTPGHTPEHIILELYDLTRSSEDPWLIFSGDLLFVGSVGRPDLLGEEARAILASQLYDTLFERIASLPEFTEVFPAHGAGSLCGKGLGGRDNSTIGYERKYNPSMQKLERGSWINELMQDMPTAPGYFARMKQLNKIGPALLERNGKLPMITSRELDLDNVQLVDVRSPRQFAAGHVKGAISLPVDTGQANWAGWLLDPARSVVLVGQDGKVDSSVLPNLQLVGIDNILGVLGDTTGLPKASLEMLGIDSIGGNSVVDVRSASERATDHIPGSRAMDIPDILSGAAASLDQSLKQVLVCEGGVRASIACSLLERKGFSDLAILDNGMQAWRGSLQSELPQTVHS